jgi:hypothetical protein
MSRVTTIITGPDGSVTRIVTRRSGCGCLTFLAAVVVLFGPAAWVVGQFERGGRGAACRAMKAAGIEMRRRRSTTTTGMLLRKVQDCTRPRNKSTKAPARSHHRRLASQRMARFSHGSRLPNKRDDLLDLPHVVADARRPSGYWDTVR